MKRITVDGQICVGPSFSNGELAFMKRNVESFKGLETLASLLEVAGNFQRLKILYLLYVHKEMCVCDLAEILEISDSAVSQHLRKLKDKNLVINRRDKQTIFYSLQDNPFIKMMIDVFELDELSERHTFYLVD